MHGCLGFGGGPFLLQRRGSAMSPCKGVARLGCIKADMPFQTHRAIMVFANGGKGGGSCVPPPKPPKHAFFLDVQARIKAHDFQTNRASIVFANDGGGGVTISSIVFANGGDPPPPNLPVF